MNILICLSLLSGCVHHKPVHRTPVATHHQLEHPPLTSHPHNHSCYHHHKKAVAKPEKHQHKSAKRPNKHKR